MPARWRWRVLNRVQLIGRLTRDPELRYISSGLPIAQFTVAVERDFRNAAGERETDFVNCVAWRKLAEQIGQYCTRGRLVAVEGRLQTRSYEASDGSRRRIVEVVGDRVWFLDRPPSGEGSRPEDSRPPDPGPDVLVEDLGTEDVSE
jgi:single-strand DNA-binding protein